MAKTKKNNKAASKDSDAIQVQPILRANSDVANFYANFVEVAHNQYEFCLAIAQIPLRLSDACKEEMKQTKKLTMDPIAQIVMPINSIKGLIRALQTQVEKYEATFKTTLKD